MPWDSTELCVAPIDVVERQGRARRCCGRRRRPGGVGDPAGVAADGDAALPVRPDAAGGTRTPSAADGDASRPRPRSRPRSARRSGCSACRATASWPTADGVRRTPATGSTTSPCGASTARSPTSGCPTPRSPRSRSADQSVVFVGAGFDREAESWSRCRSTATSGRTGGRTVDVLRPARDLGLDPAGSPSAGRCRSRPGPTASAPPTRSTTRRPTPTSTAPRARRRPCSC